jgi:putative endonuclease
MLRCADDSYYVGHTDDLERRILEHRAGGRCAYTETRLPLHLVWSQEFATREEALAAELRIKKWSRAKRRALASGDFRELKSAAKKKDWVAYRGRRHRS